PCRTFFIVTLLTKWDCIVTPLAGALRTPHCRPEVIARGRALRMGHSHLSAHYWPACLLTASSIFAFTASRLKLAPFCIGGNSIAVMASLATCCWTNTNRQNSYLNHPKYACDPFLVPFSGQPVRSKGSRRRLVR